MAASYNAITETNQGPLVNVLSWVFMVIMIMTSITKIANTWYRKRVLMLDDCLLAAAVTFSVGQTVAVAEQVAYGLGDQDAFANGGDRSKYEQASYATQLLYPVVLFFTKATTASFTSSFAPIPWVKKASMAVIYSYLAWTVVAFLVIAFQCHLPHPWQVHGNQCINMAAFWDIFAVVDIISDIAITVVPIVVVMGIQASKAQRASIIIAFSMRLLTIPLIVLRVYFINQANNPAQSSDMEEFNATLTTQMHTNVGIILTCIPFIKSILDGLQGGVMASDLRNDHARSRFVNESHESRSHELKDVSRRSRLRQKTISPVTVSRHDSTARLHDETRHSQASTDNQRSGSTPPLNGRFSPPTATPGADDITVHTTITVSSEPIWNSGPTGNAKSIF